MRHLLCTILFLTLPGAPVAAQINWPANLYDPAADADPTDPADLVLPMPCGGAMAFQKVVVPVDGANPLDDRPLRLGRAEPQTGYSDYLLSTYLRGPFQDGPDGDSHYYLSRYELNLAQFRALKDDCSEPTRRDRFAQGGVSWYEAVDLSRAYSEWLLQNAADELPGHGAARAFVRLPTEEEWEFAARGGASVDPTLFPARRFTGEEDLRDYALFQAAGSARGKLGAVGTRKANPLGLFDIYGNAEELVLEPYRLNAIGRRHGLAGGMVTRGGSVLSTEEQVYSAQRTEYPMFRTSDGKAQAAATFGVRFVLASHVATTDQRLSDIQSTWQQLADGAPGDEIDPISQLEALIERELDPRRKAALAELQLDLRQARETARNAVEQTAKSALLSGGMFLQSLDVSTARIERLKFNVGMLTDMADVASAESKTRIVTARDGFVREVVDLRNARQSVLLTFRSVLETLVNEVPHREREKAFDLLRRELLAGSQDSLVELIDRFDADLAVYEGQPDMDPETLLQLALER